MFAAEARKYIESLIQIQKTIRKEKYLRADQDVVNECIRRIDPLLSEYCYSTNKLMANFWSNHREEIRYLVPTSNYNGFKALLIHFECLDHESEIYQTKPELINS